MPALNQQELFAEGSCFVCFGASIPDALKLALLDRISQGIGVASFISRAGITDATQIAAVTALRAAAIANGWWDKCDLIYPFVGGTAQAHAQNLKSSNFTIIWSGTVTHNANGITGDGATGYGDTGYIPSTGPLWAVNSAHVGIVRRVNAATVARNYIGVTDAAAGSVQISRGIGTAMSRVVNGGPGGSVNSAALGLTVATRLNAAETRQYIGALDDVDAGAPTSSATLNLFILALNNVGVASNFNASNLTGVTAGSGITFAEYGLMEADWLAFNTALGR